MDPLRLYKLVITMWNHNYENIRWLCIKMKNTDNCNCTKSNGLFKDWQIKTMASRIKQLNITLTNIHPAHNKSMQLFKLPHSRWVLFFFRSKSVLSSQQSTVHINLFYGMMEEPHCFPACTYRHLDAFSIWSHQGSSFGKQDFHFLL